MICIFFIFCSVVSQGDIPINSGEVSVWSSPSSYPLGIILLAHNDLDGRFFAEVKPGMMIRYYDEEWKDYRVTQIIQSQAVMPNSLSTPLLIDGEVWSPTDVYSTIFSKDLVLMTCIYKDGDWSWGRLFVIAEEFQKLYRTK